MCGWNLWQVFCNVIFLSCLVWCFDSKGILMKVQGHCLVLFAPHYTSLATVFTPLMCTSLSTKIHPIKPSQFPNCSLRNLALKQWYLYLWLCCKGNKIWTFNMQFAHILYNQVVKWKWRFVSHQVQVTTGRRCLITRDLRQSFQATRQKMHLFSYSIETLHVKM